MQNEECLSGVIFFILWVSTVEQTASQRRETPVTVCVLFWDKGSYIRQILSARNWSGFFVAQQVYQLLLLIGKVSAVFFKLTCSVMWGWTYHFLRAYQVLCDKMCSYLKVTFCPGAFAFYWSWHTRTRQNQISLWIFNEVLIEKHWKLL